MVALEGCESCLAFGVGLSEQYGLPTGSAERYDDDEEDDWGFVMIRGGAGARIEAAINCPIAAAAAGEGTPIPNGDDDDDAASATQLPNVDPAAALMAIALYMPEVLIVDEVGLLAAVAAATAAAAAAAALAAFAAAMDILPVGMCAKEGSGLPTAAAIESGPP